MSRLRDVLELSLDAVYRRDLVADRFDYISPVNEQITGFSAEEFGAFGLEEFVERIHPDDRSNVEAVIAEAMANRSGTTEYRFRCRDGSYRWLSDHFVFLTDADGRPLFRVGAVRDVTGRREIEEALRESEERLRLALESAEIGIWDRDAATDRVTITPSFLRRYGLEAEMVATYEAWERLIHPEDRERIEAERRAAFATGAPLDLEFRVNLPSGGMLWIQFRGRGVTGPRGTLARVIGVLIDMTGRKEAEAALLERDLRLNLALDIAAIGTFDWNPATGEETWDDRTRAQWGLPPGLPVDHGVFEAGIHPDDRGVVEAANRRALDPAGDGRYSAEYRVIGLGDGVERSITARGQAFFESGRPFRMIGTTIEITEQKRAEAAAREQERILQSIFRAAPVGIGLVSEVGPGRRLEQANDRFLEMTGYARDELIGQDTRILYLDDEAYAAVGRVSARQLGACGRGEVETTWRRKDGTVFDLLISSSLTNAQDPEGSVIFTALDLTTLHEHERSLKRYASDLARSNEELQRFAYVASHDLQEPLRSIVSFSQLLDRRYRGRLDTDADEYLAFIIEGGVRMQALIRDLLQLSRGSRRRASPRYRPTRTVRPATRSVPSSPRSARPARRSRSTRCRRSWSTRRSSSWSSRT